VLAEARVALDQVKVRADARLPAEAEELARLPDVEDPDGA